MFKVLDIYFMNTEKKKPIVKKWKYANILYMYFICIRCMFAVI